MASHLDPSAFPHIWDAILALSDAKTLLALRVTSRGLSNAVGRRLVLHLSATGPHRTVCREHPCARCIRSHEIHMYAVPSSLSTGLLRAAGPGLDAVRVGIHTEMRGCKTLDIHGRLPPAELGLLADRVQPRTLRLTWVAHNEPLTLASTEAALAALRPRTAIINFAHINQCITEGGAHLVGPHMRTLMAPEVRRVVVRQLAHGPHYVVHGARELVLVFMYLHNREAVISLVRDCCSELARLPRAVITLVGLETMAGNFDAAELATRLAGLAADHGSRFEILTHTEYRRAVGKEQWAFEMAP